VDHNPRINRVPKVWGLGSISQTNQQPNQHKLITTTNLSSKYKCLTPIHSNRVINKQANPKSSDPTEVLSLKSKKNTHHQTPNQTLIQIPNYNNSIKLTVSKSTSITKLITPIEQLNPNQNQTNQTKTTPSNPIHNF
jgi:hypothetical protein